MYAPHTYFSWDIARDGVICEVDIWPGLIRLLAPLLVGKWLTICYNTPAQVPDWF